MVRYRTLRLDNFSLTRPLGIALGLVLGLFISSVIQLGGECEDVVRRVVNEGPQGPAGPGAGAGSGTPNLWGWDVRKNTWYLPWEYGPKVNPNLVPKSTSGHGTGEGPVLTHHESGHVYLSPNYIVRGQQPESAGSQVDPTKVIEHPIRELMRNATREWEGKLGRQSKSLDEAVGEYRRRYGRNPPKGFDRWFEFAKENDVILVDEYDTIEESLLPFRGLSPTLLRHRNSLLPSSNLYTDSWTVTVKDGNASLSGKYAHLARALDQKELMDRYVRWLPDMSWTVSVHDGPSLVVDYRLRSRLVEAAGRGEYLSDDLAQEVDDDHARWGWSLLCPPDSRFERALEGLEYNLTPVGPSFIADHRAAMDICRNPEWQHLHGTTSSPGYRPRQLDPVFSFSKMSAFSDILLTHLEQFDNVVPNIPTWRDKKSDKLVWRGSTTGLWFHRDSWWRSSQRIRLHWLGNRVGEGLKAKVRFFRRLGTGDRDGDGDGREVGEVSEVEIGRKELRDRYTDVGIAGNPHQCSFGDPTCEAVKRVLDTLPHMSTAEQASYKYVMDVDGNAWSGRFHRLLASNSVVFKSTAFPEWYADRIQPWFHYVPVKIDYSDVFDLMAFFSGDMESQNSHDELAEEIARNGREFAERHWRYEDMEVYTFRLFLEWARLLTEDRSSMDFEG